MAELSVATTTRRATAVFKVEAPGGRAAGGPGGTRAERGVGLFVELFKRALSQLGGKQELAVV